MRWWSRWAGSPSRFWPTAPCVGRLVRVPDRTDLDARQAKFCSELAVLALARMRNKKRPPKAATSDGQCQKADTK